MNQTMRKTLFWVPKFFLWVLPLLDVRHCRKLSSYSFSRKTYDLNSRKWQKPHFGPDLGSLRPNSGRQFFFFSKIWLCQSLDIMVSYYAFIMYNIRKTNNPILRKLSDGRTDGREWFHMTLSNLKRLGGKGKLTNTKMDTIQNYFGIDIFANVGNLAAVKSACMA